jgi:hypothetical protein
MIIYNKTMTASRFDGTVNRIRDYRRQGEIGYRHYDEPENDEEMPF